MKKTVIGMAVAVSGVLLADTLYWVGPDTSGNREGAWMGNNVWVSATTGIPYTWQAGDTHDVVFDPSGGRGNGWYTRIELPADGVTPNSVLVVANVPACWFRSDGAPAGPGTLVTPKFTSKPQRLFNWEMTRSRLRGSTPRLPSTLRTPTSPQIPPGRLPFRRPQRP